jgi:hypothetical protein
MSDCLPSLVQVKGVGPQDDSVGALFGVAVQAVLLGRHLQAGEHRGLAIHHHVLVHVLAARPMAHFALHALAEGKGVVPLPRFRLRGRGVTAQAHGRLLRLHRNAAPLGDLLRLRLGQTRVRLGVSRMQPQRQLIAHRRPLVALAAGFGADVDGLPIGLRSQD